MTGSILVRAPNWVGDAVMALPFFASLRRNAPHASVTCLCRPTLAPLYRCVPEIDSVIELDESHGRHGLPSVWRNAAQLRARGFDAAFCLPTSLGSAAMIWLARIPRRVGHAADRRKLLLTDTLPFGRNGQRPHRAEGYLNLLELVWPGATMQREFAFLPGPESSATVDSLLPESRNAVPSPILAMAPGAAQANKMWDPLRFAKIGQRWVDSFRGTVILVGAGAERRSADEIAEAINRPGTRNLCGAGDLVVTAEIIRRADIFLGNDSGLAHLAPSVGTPAVVISGPGDPSEVAPFTTRAVTVRRPVFCSPCFKNYCWRKDTPLECLTEVGVDDVWSQVSQLAATLTKST